MLATFTRRFITRLMFGLAMLIAVLPLAMPVEAGWHSLTGRLPAYANIFYFIISPDSRYAVFVADIEVDGLYELYSVPLTGAVPLTLNPPLVDGGGVYDVAITPDSQYVIYTARQEAGESEADLYRVPITGGPVVKLNAGPMVGHDVEYFEIDPDNVYVVYQAEQQVEDQIELFSVPIAGGAVVPLNPPLVAGGEVDDFAIDPISNRVVYRARQEVYDRDDLYGVPIAGGTAVKLNPSDLAVRGFEINPQAPEVVFRAGPGGDYSYLYMNATTGGLLTPLNYPLANNENVVGFHINPDGTQVVYNVAVSTPTKPFPDRGKLYSVLSGGGDSILLTTSADPGYGVYSDNFDITADSQRVVYGYQKNALSSRILESVALTGDKRTTLYDNTDEIFDEQRLSPDGRWLVYDTYPSLQMYAIPTAGGLNIPLGLGGFPNITPDSSRVIFNDNQPPFDLRSVPIAGGEADNLSRAGDEVEVWDSLISPDGRWIVFGVRYKAGNFELRVSDGAEAQPPTPTPPPTSNIFPVYLPLIVR